MSQLECPFISGRLMCKGTSCNLWDVSAGKCGLLVAPSPAPVSPYPTFIASAIDIVPAVNAYLIALLNRNTAKVVRVWRANVYVSSEASVTGVLLKASLVRISATAALSGGVSVTPVQMDTVDTLPANVDIQTKPTSAITVVGEFKRFLLSGDEAVVTTLDADAFAAEVFPRDAYSLFECPGGMVKPLVLRSDGTTHQGFAVQCLAGAVGNVGLQVVFTVSGT